ncbi:MAG: mechanosensitive ion channel family protein [Clostridiales bacterium]|nr:mechanosensitive ion channel family protein [Clostridiales bacterium]
MPQFFNHVIYGNTVSRYLLFVLSLFAGVVIIRIFRYFVIRRMSSAAKRTKSSADDHVVESIKRYLVPAAYIAVFYLSTKILALGPKLFGLINALALAVFMILGALFVSSIVVMLLNKYWEGHLGDANKDLAIKTMSGLLRIVIWVIAVILFLDNIGVKINTLIAGVGIGGIAIAFAAQSILGDIFCFFTIFFDRPFEIGDFIITGTQSGTVEHIGLKTTRLRALTGEQLIFSNTDLTNSRIQNYKTMEQRRALFSLSISYNTSCDKLREIPEMIKNIIESIPNTTFGRAHFAAYGEFGLNFEVVYYILSNSYDTYMDIHQQVNLGIKEQFEKKDIGFAFPIRTVRMENSRNQ